MRGTILIIEDEAVLARSIKRSLEREGHEVTLEGSAEAGLATFRHVGPTLVLLDLRLPEMGGMEFLRTIREQGHDHPVIVMSAHADVRTAVEAMRLGAYDYVTKPLDLGELKLVVARALDHAQLAHELTYFRERADREQPASLPLGDCPEMRRVTDQVQRIARMERQSGSGAPSVLVLGETGTGKGLAARAIHRLGPRSTGPFIDVNCGALPDTLLEAELFGYEKGAFTDARGTRHGLFEAADRGTLFLDEVGHLNLSAQTKLLKVIEEKTFRRLGSTAERRVDVRIIAATNRDLGAAQVSGAFRPELYHRLKVLTIELPPLRERGDDVIVLAEHFVRHHAEQYGLPARKLAAGAREILLGYGWPGNVRELINEIERAVLLETGEEITLGHLRGTLSAPTSPAKVHADATGGIAVDLPVEGVAFAAIESAVLLRALQLNGLNVTQTARFLHLSRDTLRYRIERLNLTSAG